MDDELRRPEPPRALSDRALAWVAWMGVTRLVTSAVAVAVVCVGGWWLVRSPTPSPESGLPVASASAPGGPTTSSGVRSAGGPPKSSVASEPLGTRPNETAVAAPSEFVVHVTGAVERPGIYTFDPGARLADAVEQAGGATADGRPHELNLAAPLVDGMRVDVPIDGEEVDPSLVATPLPGAPAPNAARSSDGPAIGLVDVNRASVDELESLPGVGPATASAIVTERELNGPFVSVDDLERVPGIGPARLAAIRDSVTT